MSECASEGYAHPTSSTTFDNSSSREGGWLYANEWPPGKAIVYVIELPHTGTGIPLRSKEDFDRMCSEWLTDETGPKFFGSGWMRFKRKSRHSE